MLKELLMAKKLTTEDFIAKAKEVHGNKYDYSKSIYAGTDNKLIIICPEHGDFKQTAYHHISRKQGCPTCSGRNKTTEDFIAKTKEVHGEKYDYSMVKYIGVFDKVTIICPEHGEFQQTLRHHISRKQGCPTCSGRNKTTEDFIAKAKEVHGEKYDYSMVKYVKSYEKVIIICPEHGEFEQTPSNHLNGAGCTKCAGVYQPTTEEFIQEARDKHGDKYDYSKVNYVGTNSKVIIIDEYGCEHNITPYSLLRGSQTSIKSAVNKSKYFSSISRAIHGDKYNYSKVEYSNNTTKIIIICPEHGEFEQTPSDHLNGCACPICNHGFTKSYQLKLLQELSETDLLTMDAIELLIIIGQGKLPTSFKPLVYTEAESDERITTLRELQEQFESESEESEGVRDGTIEDVNHVKTTDTEEPEFTEIDDVDINEISEPEEPTLPTINGVRDLHALDNSIYAGMDEEAFATLIEYKLRKLWNSVLNNEIQISDIENETGSKYFNIIKETFLEEYNQTNLIQPKDGYIFPYQPNLMQKLTVYRLLKNKYYGNWSGTGAGKTLSFVLASRDLNSKLTLVVALNSTITQTGNAIKSVYPDSEIYTNYKDEYVFDRSKNNFLILNYEKFQQEYSEEMLQQLTNNNQIDFIVIDEVHNVKQRTEEEESIRRGTLIRLLGRARQNNNNLHVLAMSATPVINDLYEAKSLLELMSGDEYTDVQTRKTVANAMIMFKHLTINGLRFRPKYDIDIHELTGSNMSNLSIDGTPHMDSLLELGQGGYIGVEQLILDDKLNNVKHYFRKGVIIYSYFTTGFIGYIQKYIESLGFKVGTYTGEESPIIRNSNLTEFKKGNLDILIGSRPIGTGVDGLQEVCDRIIILSLPWTNAEYEQLKGRIYRQGSLFQDVEIIIPQVKIELEDGNIWSWDIQRLNLIRSKKTLADAAVDGIIPSRILPKPETLFRKSLEALSEWKERVGVGDVVNTKRNKFQIDLYPEINSESERERRINSELSEFNRRGKTLRSETMHKEFFDNPDSWFRYHALRKSRMESWEEIPYEYIATKITDKRDILADFGCGENLFKNCVPNNKIYSFDHVAIDDSVIACDMKHTGLEDETINVAVFSLALWGSNYKDYLIEAYRIIDRRGDIYIAEPSKHYENLEEQQELIIVLEECGFHDVKVECRGKFIYFTGRK